MFSLFALFGRSAAMKALDHALREVGLHPLVVPDAVKITIMRLHKQGAGAEASCREATYGDAAQLLVYCMVGRDQFIASNSVQAVDRADLRVEHALIAGDSIDAKLILLALHSIDRRAARSRGWLNTQRQPVRESASSVTTRNRRR